MSIPTADVVVVAAGTSSRMDGLDKVAAPIGGRPLLAWTLASFAGDVPVERIAVVVAPERISEFSAAPWLPSNATVVAGGPRRQDSVAAGVNALASADASDDRVILVHDGARPVVRPSLVRDVIEAAAAHGAAIPVLPVVETLKRVADGVIEGTVDRTGLGAAQTPQGVRLGLLREAYRRFPPGGPEVFTDEAALLEACTIPVHVVPGSPDNLKVTLPADLDRAVSILVAEPPRVGFGEDAHPFGSGAPLALGGLEFFGAPRLHGHSDGDVVLHAVADALLGAAGLGDLGRLYPADQRTPRGIASQELLQTVLRRVREAGYAPSSVDVTIVAARPRLGERLDSMRDRIAEITGLGADRVNVKASTGNLGGDEGAGRGIAARAIATLEPRR